MEKLFIDMKALYEARRLSGIDAFIAKWLAPECVIMGTALGELMLTREDVRNLFDSDLRYWYDLAIDEGSAKRETVGDLEYISCGAEISYSILENEKRYAGYVSLCESIAKDTAAAPVRAANIAFVLDTLLSSRKNKRRKNRLPLRIHVLLRESKAIFICFAFDKTMDAADHYIGDSADTAKSYAEERALLCGGHIPCVADFLGENGYEDAAYDLRGDVFYGVALLRRTETLGAYVELS